MHTLFVLAVTGLLASSCAPTREQYDAVVTVLEGSQRARQQVVKDCAAGWTASARYNAGLITDVATKDAPRVACERFTRAMISGRATYEDVVDIKRHHYTPKLIKIFQGR